MHKLIHVPNSEALHLVRSLFIHIIFSAGVPVICLGVASRPVDLASPTEVICTICGCSPFISLSLFCRKGMVWVARYFLSLLYHILAYSITWLLLRSWASVSLPISLVLFVDHSFCCYYADCAAVFSEGASCRSLKMAVGLEEPVDGLVSW